MKRNRILLLHLALALSAAPLAHAQTAFTYQGKLIDDCCPATGFYDMRFKVLDAPTGGMQYGATWLVPAVPVTNGLFNASLDFGNAPFDGSRRWLEIEVRTNSASPSATFALLSPRTELTATPYAIRALSASSMPSNSISGFNISAGQVVKSLNGLKDNVTISGGSNVTVTTSGNNIVVSATGGGSAGPWQQSGANVYLSSGNVGIGTTSPNWPLTLTSGSTIGIKDPIQAGWGTFLTQDSAGNGTLAVAGHGLAIYGGFDQTLQLGAAQYSQFGGKVVFPGGNVGIGTINPTAPLHISASRVGGITTGNQASLLVTNTATGAGFNFGLIAGGKTAIGAFSAAGKTAYLANNSHAGQFYGDVSVDGSVGIGTTAPLAPLDLVRYQAYMRLLSTNSYNGSVLELRNNTPGLNVNLGAINFAGFDGNVPGQIAYGADTGFSFRAGGAIRMNIFEDGTVSVPVLQIRGGADLAEPFQMSEEKIPEGSVVVIDEENPGHLRQATSAYDTRVAGIVSGANGVKAGIALHQEGVLEGGQNVALTGRVYVKADASFGAIKPGDLLTTSDTPGHAMKVLDHELAHGAILGKAMTPLSEGTGMVLVLVSLQ